MHTSSNLSLNSMNRSKKFLDNLKTELNIQETNLDDLISTTNTIIDRLENFNDSVCNLTTDILDTYNSNVSAIEDEKDEKDKMREIQIKNITTPLMHMITIVKNNPINETNMTDNITILPHVVSILKGVNKNLLIFITYLAKLQEKLNRDFNRFVGNYNLINLSISDMPKNIDTHTILIKYFIEGHGRDVFFLVNLLKFQKKNFTKNLNSFLEHIKSDRSSSGSVGSVFSADYENLCKDLKSSDCSCIVTTYFKFPSKTAIKKEMYYYLDELTRINFVLKKLEIQYSSGSSTTSSSMFDILELNSFNAARVDETLSDFKTLFKTKYNFNMKFDCGDMYEVYYDIDGVSKKACGGASDGDSDSDSEYNRKFVYNLDSSKSSSSSSDSGSSSSKSRSSSSDSGSSSSKSSSSSSDSGSSSSKSRSSSSDTSSDSNSEDEYRNFAKGDFGYEMGGKKRRKPEESGDLPKAKIIRLDDYKKMKDANSFRGKRLREEDKIEDECEKPWEKREKELRKSYSRENNESINTKMKYLKDKTTSYCDLFKPIARILGLSLTDSLASLSGYYSGISGIDSYDNLKDFVENIENFGQLWSLVNVMFYHPDDKNVELDKMKNKVCDKVLNDIKKVLYIAECINDSSVSSDKDYITFLSIFKDLHARKINIFPINMSFRDFGFLLTLYAKQDLPESIKKKLDFSSEVLMNYVLNTVVLQPHVILLVIWLFGVIEKTEASESTFNKNALSTLRGMDSDSDNDYIVVQYVLIKLFDVVFSFIDKEKVKASKYSSITSDVDSFQMTGYMCINSIEEFEDYIPIMLKYIESLEMTLNTGNLFASFDFNKEYYFSSFSNVNLLTSLISDEVTLSDLYKENCSGLTLSISKVIKTLYFFSKKEGIEFESSTGKGPSKYEINNFNSLVDNIGDDEFFQYILQNNKVEDFEKQYQLDRLNSKEHELKNKYDVIHEYIIDDIMCIKDRFNLYKIDPKYDFKNKFSCIEINYFKPMVSLIIKPYHQENFFNKSYSPLNLKDNYFISTIPFDEIPQFKKVDKCNHKRIFMNTPVENFFRSCDSDTCKDNYLFKTIQKGNSLFIMKKEIEEDNILEYENLRNRYNYMTIVDNNVDKNFIEKYCRNCYENDNYDNNMENSDYDNSKFSNELEKQFIFVLSNIPKNSNFYNNNFCKLYPSYFVYLLPNIKSKNLYLNDLNFSYAKGGSKPKRTERVRRNTRRNKQSKDSASYYDDDYFKTLYVPKKIDHNISCNFLTSNDISTNLNYPDQHITETNTEFPFYGEDKLVTNIKKFNFENWKTNLVNNSLKGLQDLDFMNKEVKLEDDEKKIETIKTEFHIEKAKFDFFLPALEKYITEVSLQSKTIYLTLKEIMEFYIFSNISLQAFIKKPETFLFNTETDIHPTNVNTHLHDILIKRYGYIGVHFETLYERFRTVFFNNHPYDDGPMKHICRILMYVLDTMKAYISDVNTVHHIFSYIKLNQYHNSFYIYIMVVYMFLLQSGLSV